MITGLDVSKWQGAVDFSALDVDFVCAKASHGESGVDSLFATHKAAICDAGKSFGAYHWYLPTHDPIAQARHFVACVGAIGRGDFGLAIDVEDAQGLKGDAIAKPLLQMVCEVVALTGRRPAIYCADWFWTSHVGVDVAELAQCPLWVAQYPSTQPDRRSFREAAQSLTGSPRLPLPWAKRGILETIWQFDGDGGLRLPNGVDVDVNRMSSSQMSRFIESTRASELRARSVDDPATMQETLNSLGYDCGKADGIVGPKTKAALDRFAQTYGLEVYEVHDRLENIYKSRLKSELGDIL